jgi:hypothetical protein
MIERRRVTVWPGRLGPSDSWQLFDEGCHHFLTILGEDGRPNEWIFHRGAEQIALVDDDGDGVPDARTREIESADGRASEQRFDEVRHGGRWVLRQTIDYRTCVSTGNYREVTFHAGGRRTVAWHSCIVS